MRVKGQGYPLTEYGQNLKLKSYGHIRPNVVLNTVLGVMTEFSSQCKEGFWRPVCDLGILSPSAGVSIPSIIQHQILSIVFIWNLRKKGFNCSMLVIFFLHLSFTRNTQKLNASKRNSHFMTASVFKWIDIGIHQRQ